MHANLTTPKQHPLLNCAPCRYVDFSADWYRKKERELKIREIFHYHSASKVDFVNRKFWEWCAISEALDQRGMLLPGSNGLGFAVGTEPLTSYFASRGCEILATDLAPELSAEAWKESNQHAAALDQLFYPELIDRASFSAGVSFSDLDMRNISNAGFDYDFLWSSCALEHLGTLKTGIDFVINSAKLLRKGGVAVHTTEYNISSDVNTIHEGHNVLYRKQDFIDLGELLGSIGFSMSPLGFDTGQHAFDYDYDTPPYMGVGKRHLKLEIEGYISTSYLIILERVK
jgi:hypothetical protein